jgi:hypothetical protein
VDRHRPIHGVCTWAHSAPRQRIGSPRNHAAINAANAFSHACFLTPVNVFVCMELQKANPNMIKIAAWMQRYFYVVAMQGIMQVAIIVVMTRFRAGI